MSRCGALLRCAILALTPLAAPASTIYFFTLPGGSIDIGSGPIFEDAEVTFITGPGTVEIRIKNNQVGSGSLYQAVSGVDFLLSSTAPPPTVDSWSGTAIHLAKAPGNPTRTVDYTVDPSGFTTNTWTSGASSQISGGTGLTALAGRNTTQTILGPPNSNNQYLADKDFNSGNPYLQTTRDSYVSFLLHYASSVDADTTVIRASLTFGTSGAAGSAMELDTQAPEPLPSVLLGTGLAALLFVRRAFRGARPAFAPPGASAPGARG